jgi:hypothetical protein
LRAHILLVFPQKVENPFWVQGWFIELISIALAVIVIALHMRAR